MPTVLMILGWRFFFYADEGNEPIHIHCRKGDAEAKYWLDAASFAAVEAHALFFGNPKQFLIQLVGVSATLLYSLAGTFVIYKLVDAVIGVRVKEREERMGLDITQHRERAYTMLE